MIENSIVKLAEPGVCVDGLTEALAPCTVKKTFEDAAAPGALLIAQAKDNLPPLHQCAEQVCQTSNPVDQERQAAVT